MDLAENRVQKGKRRYTHIYYPILFLLQRLNALHEVRGVLIIVPDDPHTLTEKNGHM